MDSHPGTIGIDFLTTYEWDILLITPGMSSLAASMTQRISTHWSICVKIPIHLLDNYAAETHREYSAVLGMYLQSQGQRKG